MSILKKGGHLVALKSVPTGVFAKRMNLPEEIIGISTHIGSEIDEYAKSLGVTYDFLFVTSSGTQLQEATKIITNHNIKLTVDTVYQFDEVSKALDKVDKKLSRGKTVLVISE